MKPEERTPDPTSDVTSDVRWDRESERDPVRSPGAWMKAFAAELIPSKGGTTEVDDREELVASWIERGRAGLEPIEQRLSAVLAKSNLAAIAASEARIMERLDRIESRLSDLEPGE